MRGVNCLSGCWWNCTRRALKQSSMSSQFIPTLLTRLW